jgi:hypothetical protein
MSVEKRSHLFMLIQAGRSLAPTEEPTRETKTHIGLIREGLQYCSARALHVFLSNGLLAGAEPIADTHRIFGNLDF